MQTILVLTDFSDAAFHAACYAGGLTLQFHSKTLILFHAYDVLLPVPGSGDIAQQTSDALHDQSIENLESLHRQLDKFINPLTTVHCIADPAILSGSINEITKDINADLIVMGITGKSAIEQTLVGSHTISVAEVSNIPLLIVPQDAAIAPIERIVFTCDMQDVSETVPIEPLKKILSELHAPLMVVNVKHDDTVTAETTEQKTALETLLSDNHASFHSVENDDTIEGIMDFSLTNRASLIIVLPKDHGFLDGLFHKSVTKKLAYHSSIPLLVLHEHVQYPALQAEPF